MKALFNLPIDYKVGHYVKVMMDEVFGMNNFRIINTSSNPESMVLDCFCGSGTTLKSAHLLNRRWIGIDQSEQAIKATIDKLSAVDCLLLKYELISLL